SRLFGGVGALMAPRLIARPIAFPVRWGAPAPATASEVEGDLTRHRNPFDHSSTALCHSSRVKAQPASRPSRTACPARSVSRGAGPGGRLAQLVRALP